MDHPQMAEKGAIGSKKFKRQGDESCNGQAFFKIKPGDIPGKHSQEVSR